MKKPIEARVGWVERSDTHHKLLQNREQLNNAQNRSSLRAPTTNLANPTHEQEPATAN
jgi:hypothetical protein